MIGHVTPEAHLGGPIACEDGDTITVDADNAEINLHVSDEELAARQAKWQAPEAYTQRGTLAKYAQFLLRQRRRSHRQVSELIVAEEPRALVRRGRRPASAAHLSH